MQKIGKEVKIGLAVIGVLLTTFGYVLVKRLTRPSEANAATVADASRASDNAHSPVGAFDRPTMLDGSALKGPTIVPVAAKSNGFGDDSSRRHPSDSSASDPAAGSSDSFMPARAITSSSDSHPANPTRDDQVAAAGYGAGNGSASGYGAGSTPSGYGTPANSSGGYGPASAKTGSQNTAASDSGAVGKVVIDNSQSPAFPPLYGAAAATPAADAGDHHPAHAADNAGQATAVDPFQIRASTNGRGDPVANDSPAQVLPSRDGLGAVSGPTPRATSANRGDAGPAPRQFDSSAASARPTEMSVRGSDPNAYQAPVPPPDVPRNDPTPSYAPPATATSTLTTVAPIGNPYAVPRSADSAAAPQQLGADTPARKAGQYVVQPNDNYWTISEKVYGSGAYFKAIFEYNRNRHPQADRLQVGEALDTPDASVLQSTYPDLCPKAARAASAGRVVPASARMVPGTRVYTVEEGDTLFEIARRELGKPSRWSEIYQLNRDTLGGDFDYLRPGTELLLPADGNGSGATSTPVARDQSGTILR